MNNITKYILFLPFVLLLVSCGGDSSSDDSFTYYQKKPVEPSKLDLTIEASGEVEAIYSVEIKSKASGEILDLPAEVGDFVEKGSILARIDQRTPKNILDQAKLTYVLQKFDLQMHLLNWKEGLPCIMKEVLPTKISKKFKKVLHLLNPSMFDPW